MNQPVKNPVRAFRAGICVRVRIAQTHAYTVGTSHTYARLQQNALPCQAYPHTETYKGGAKACVHDSVRVSAEWFDSEAGLGTCSHSLTCPLARPPTQSALRGEGTCDK